MVTDNQSDEREKTWHSVDWQPHTRPRRKMNCFHGRNTFIYSGVADSSNQIVPVSSIIHKSKTAFILIKLLVCPIKTNFSPCTIFYVVTATNRILPIENRNIATVLGRKRSSWHCEPEIQVQVTVEHVTGKFHWFSSSPATNQLLLNFLIFWLRKF